MVCRGVGKCRGGVGCVGCVGCVRASVGSV